MNMMPPNFLTKRKEPAMDASPIHPKTAQILDDIQRTAQRCQELESENRELLQRLDALHRERDFLRLELSTAERKRDMFHRHSVALFTRLADMIASLDGYRATLSKALEEARQEAKAITPTDEAAERAIATALDEHRTAEGQ